jgi:5'-3' exonuclease
MIIMDFNGIAVGSIFANGKLEEGMVRHMVFNTIRMYKTKFEKEYGETIIACDGANNWRRSWFPQYKASRRKSREKSDFDWDRAYEILNDLRTDIRENFPYKLVHIEGCEADDVIATLVEQTQEFGKNEDVMIISADKDFVQLQTYGNVRQFSPLTKKFVAEQNPNLFRQTHIFKGDTSDGVPNVLSGDNVFVEGLRQTPLSKKKIEALIADPKSLGEEVYRNIKRNEKLIDLRNTPSDLKESIINSFENQDPWKNKSKVFPYMVGKQMNMLLESVEEFL